MKIETKQINEDEMNLPEAIDVNFPKGIIGFPGYKQFKVTTSAKVFPFFKLECLDEPALQFAIIDPWLFKQDYQLEISDYEQNFLNAKNGEDLMIFSIVTFGKGGRISINLAAPVVVNIEKGIGAQLILDDPDIPVKFFVDTSN